jgi:hypothetical protein
MSLVKRKKRNPNDPQVTVTFRLPMSKSRKVKIRSAEIGISKSLYVERALDAAFKNGGVGTAL